MDMNGLHELIVKLNRDGQLPAFFIGFLVAIVVLFMISRLFRLRMGTTSRRNPEIARLVNGLEGTRTDNRRLQDELDQARRERDASCARASESEGIRQGQSATIVQLSAECERVKEEGIAARDRCADLEFTEGRIRRRVLKLTKRLDRMAVSDGKQWEVPPGDRIPPFRPLTQRKTPIISVVNLKGGVGKTTLTANLGAAMATLGRRVLMVDLDHQGSLSQVCMTGAEWDDAVNGRRLIHTAFGEPAEGLAAFRAAVTRLSQVPNGEAHLVAANDELAEVEMQWSDRWRAGGIADDVRFRLRAILHTREIAERFDVILLDCPPRLTTACVNALAASDFALIPVLPQPLSTAAVPRLLKWLRKLRPVACPDLAVLGVIGNKARFYGPGPVARQVDELRLLEGYSQDAWGEPIHFFSPMKAHDPVNGTLAALDPKFATMYRDLAEEILKELPNHARRRPSSVPSSLGPPASRLRG